MNDGQVQEGEVDAIGVECDVSSETAVKTAMAQIVDRFGRIDCLVASAGIVRVFLLYFIQHSPAILGIVENYAAMEYAVLPQCIPLVDGLF